MPAPFPIFDDPSALNALYQAAGGSLDPKEVCRAFFRALGEHWGMDHAAAWSTAVDDPNRLVLLHTEPASDDADAEISASHPLVVATRARGFLSFAAASDDGKRYGTGSNSRSGFVLAFPLGDYGVLEARASARSTPFSTDELGLARLIADHFARSLRSGLQHVQVLTQLDEARRLANELDRTARIPIENPNPIIRLDSGGGLTFANRAARSLLKSITGSEAFVPEDWVRLAASSFQSASPEQAEVAVRGRWLNLLFVPVPHEGYVNLYGFDTTPLKLAQADLAETKSFYEQILNSMPAQLAVFDRELRYEYITPSAVGDEEVRKWMIGKTDIDYCRYRNLDLDIANQRQETVKQVMASGEETRFEESFRGRDGKLRHFVRMVAPVFDTRGEVAHVLGYGLDITELRQATKALQESEERWRSLVESHPDPLLVTRHWKILFANQAAHDLLGAVDLVGSDLGGFVAPELQHILAERQKDLEAGQSTLPKDCRLVRPDGTERLVEAFSVPVRFEGVDAAQTVLRDITERRAAEQRIRASEEIKAAVISSALDAVVTMNHEGLVVDWNPAAEHVFGYEKAEAVGQAVADLIIPPQMREAHAEGLRRYFETGEGPVIGTRIEIEGVRKDGASFPVELAITAVHTEDRPPVFTAYIRDISERRRAEAALRESEARFKDLVESAADIIYRSSPDGQILYVNPIGMRIMGLDSESVKSLRAFDLVSEEARPEVSEFYIRQIHDHTYSTYLEFPSVTLDGRHIWIGQTVQLVEEDGQVVALQAVARDITERKEIEDALVEAKQTAEASMRARELFLANMSHEMRTPLNAVIGMTHLLFDTHPTPKQGAYLGGIKYSADNLLALINDLLDIAKIESGHIEFEHIPFRPVEVLGRVAEAVSFHANEKGIQLIYDVDDRLPDVLVGDPSRLNQILLNLVGNAVTFTERGRVRLAARAERGVEGEVVVEFIVSDTGIGIPADKLDMVFEVFQQARSDTSRRYGGTGLGLAIVRQLTERQGGTIRVESEEGRGSSFFVTLSFPIYEGDVPAWSGTEADAVDLAGARILVVEDNEMNQFVTTEMLKGWGARVEVAENGLIAVNLIRERPYDLVLMDIQMPEMDGYEATRAVRTDLGISADELPILALTASVLLNQRTSMVEAGMNDVLFKPFDPSTLRNRLAYFLGGRTERENKPASPRPAAPPPKIEKAPQPPVVSVVDLSLLREASAGREDVARKIIDLFLQQTPEQLGQIEQALETGDRDRVAFVSHKAKSAAGMMGIRRLAELLRDLEKGAHGDPYEVLRARLTEAHVISARALAELYAERRKLGDA